jgi:hypothetical protein
MSMSMDFFDAGACACTSDRKINRRKKMLFAIMGVFINLVIEFGYGLANNGASNTA